MFDRNAPLDGAAIIASISRNWLIDEGYASSMELALCSMSMADVARIHMEQKDRLERDVPRAPYITQDGIAYISVTGPMSKGLNSMSSIFGGTSTKTTSSALQTAAGDKEVKSIMMIFDSPGGSVDGSFDLANTVRLIGRHKSIDAYIEDNCMSAAYLVAAQCRTIYANSNALAGSIGAYTQLVDSSKVDQMRGIRRITVYSGEHKAIGAPGREVTDAHIEHVQGRIDKITGLFNHAVMEGRNLSDKQLAAVANGGVFVGEQARKLHLVDQIKTMEAAHMAASKANQTQTAGKTKGTQMAEEIDLSAVRGWLAAADDDTTLEQVVAPVVAITPVEPVVAQVQTQVQEHPLVAALGAIGIKDTAALDGLVARANMGDEYITRVRTQCAQLAVISLGPEAGAMAATTMTNMELPLLRAMAQQYEGIAVAKKLIPPPGGSPLARSSAAGEHPQVGAVADTTGGAKPTEQQLMQNHMQERYNSGIYHM